MAYEVGRICVKIAGRDAGQKCIIVDKIDETHVLIDGNTRRRKCNIMHLVPTTNLVKISTKASTGEVKEVLSKKGLKVKPVTKPKKAGQKPKKKRTVKEKVTDKKPKKEKPTKEKVKEVKPVEVKKPEIKKEVSTPAEVKSAETKS